MGSMDWNEYRLPISGKRKSKVSRLLRIRLDRAQAAEETPSSSAQVSSGSASGLRSGSTMLRMTSDISWQRSLLNSSNPSSLRIESMMLA
jgi:hypothetical protein